MVAQLQHTEFRESPIDRPNGRSIFMESHTFHLYNSDLLSQGYGLLAQEADKDMALHAIHMEAQHESAGYVWQYTIAPQYGGRTVTQMSVDHAGRLEGWTAKYRPNGGVSIVADMGPEDCIHLWEGINEVLNSQYLHEKAEEMRSNREKLLDKLSQFLINGETEYWVRADETVRRDKAIASYIDKTRDVEMLKFKINIKPGSRESKKQIDQKKKAINGIGFTALRSHAKPTV
jgi:hypothetical protein